MIGAFDLLRIRVQVPLLVPRPPKGRRPRAGSFAIWGFPADLSSTVIGCNWWKVFNED